MEKIIYPVWKHETDSADVLKQKLLGEVSDRLINQGVRKLRICLVDEDVAPAEPLCMSVTRPPVSGIISLWVDTSNNRKMFEDIIESAVARMVGYLVTESEPIVNTRHVVPDGKRTPGMNHVVFLQKPPRLNYDHWLETWLDSHTQIAIDTQSTFGYRQNVIVRSLTYAAPQYSAIIEENFPAEAMTNPMAFYDAVGDEAKYKKHEQEMVESCIRFIDFDKIDRIPTSEYIMKS